MYSSTLEEVYKYGTSYATNSWCSLTYTIHINPAIKIGLSKRRAVLMSLSWNWRKAEKELLFLDNPILIGKQNYLAWLMCRSNYTSYWLQSLFWTFNKLFLLKSFWLLTRNIPLYGETCKDMKFTCLWKKDQCCQKWHSNHGQEFKKNH